MAAFHQWASEALPLFYKAIELDPNFAAAYGMASRCYGQHKARGTVTDRAFEVTETARLAKRAAELGKDDAVALYTAELSLVWVVGDLDGAVALTDRALLLNPNLAGPWFVKGWTMVMLGELEKAIECEGYNHTVMAEPSHPGQHGQAALSVSSAIPRNATRHHRWRPAPSPHLPRHYRRRL